jgi:hypothetical protein
MIEEVEKGLFQITRTSGEKIKVDTFKPGWEYNLSNKEIKEIQDAKNTLFSLGSERSN